MKNWFRLSVKNTTFVFQNSQTLVVNKIWRDIICNDEEKHEDLGFHEETANNIFNSKFSNLLSDPNRSDLEEAKWFPWLLAPTGALIVIVVYYTSAAAAAATF